MPQIFSADDSALFFRLLLSHLLVAIFLKPTTWVQQKRYQSFLYQFGHSLFAGALAYLLAGNWQSIWLIMVVGLTHGLIDYLKLTYGKQKPLRAFLADQAAHIFILFAAWLWLTDNGVKFWKLISLILTNYSFMAVLCGYIICTTPIGFAIGIATAKWQRQLSSSDALADAGKWIGIAERIVIFSFVLVNQYEAIGFLIAAKSLLRFREGEKTAMQSEYVLVGTLLSYSLAILMGLLTKLTIE